jgi:fatty-acyl-CoA synthase
MDSTMQDYSLTATSILRYGTSIYADRTVTTATDPGVRTISYRELGARVAALANGLRRLGVTGDDRVATFMWNNQEHLEAYLAVPSMGAVLHTLNIRLSAEQIAFVANDAEDRVVLVDMSLASQLATVLAQMDKVHTVIAVGAGDTAALAETGKAVIGYDELIAGEPTAYPWPEIDEKSAAAMAYTSGTTGHPKGVLYSHRSIYLHSTAVCSANAIGLSEGDRVLPIVPMFHANAWGLPVAAVLAGADLVLPDRFLSADRLIDLIETYKPTVAGAVPTIWNDVLHRMESDPGRDISSLRLIMCGGSAVPESLMRAFDDKFGVALMQLWGMTETSPVASLARPPEGTTQEQAWQLRASQGRPLFGIEMRIVDNTDRPLPNDGESVGELEVRGPWVTGSYYRGRDSDRFAGGWLRTGDVGRMDSRGYVKLTDRAKDVIKSGGEWISSVELENHIMAHPCVVEAAVVGVPDERWQERPLAVVVVKDDADISACELRNYLRDRVVRWWLPERWAFLDHVPRTSVGKFDKKMIRTRYADNAFEVVECHE